jgi:hypothetical protein
MSMLHAEHHTDHHPHAGRVAAAVGEFIYVVDALILALVAAVFVIGGLSPFESPVMTVVTLLALAVVAVHHLWWMRNRADAERAETRRRGRERRGF